MRKETRENDLLYGVSAIAAHLEVRYGQAYHMIEKGDLPTFRVAGRVCARRSSLTAWVAECEAKAREARS
jgi:hypothetical protein